MSNAYDADKYGVIERQWFGMEKQAATTTFARGAWSLGTKGATTLMHVPYWMPKGPIKVLKVGKVTTTAIANASSAYRVLRLYTRGASASVLTTLTPACATTAIGTSASTTTFTVSQCKAGEYISIKSASLTTAKGTEKLSTQTGSFAVWIDYVRTYSGSKHDAT